MKREYNTKQKDEIRKVISSLSGGHFTAEDVLETLKRSGSGIGLSTVYRNLDALARSGELVRYAANAGESACYGTPCAGEHFHLRCVKCGKLEHLSCEHLSSVEKHVLAEHGFLIDKASTVFSGTCAKCRESENA